MNNEFEIKNPRITEFWQQGLIVDALHETIETRSTADDRLKAFLGSKGAAEDTAFGALTLGDLIYDFCHVDPSVLEAAEFSHVRSIKDVFSFALWSAKFDDLNDAAGRGAVNGLQGFTAERLFAVHLENQGHDVQLEHVPNYPGADALVDGHPFQFKCLDSIQGVRDHFAVYDYPVIVNNDLAGEVAGMHGVYVDELVQRDEVRQLTEASMHHGAGMADGHIPWISFIASTPLPLYRLYKRETDISGAVAAVISNSSGKIAGGLIGGKSGAIAGSMLFGPAGAVVGLSLGSIAGARTGRRIAGLARNIMTQSEANAVRSAALETATTALESFPRKRNAWNEKRTALSSTVVRDSAAIAIRKYIVVRHDDDLAYLENQAELLNDLRADAVSSDPVELWQRVLSLTKRAGIHAHVIQEPLRRLEALVAEFKVAKKRWMAT